MLERQPGNCKCKRWAAPCLALVFILLAVLPSTAFASDTTEVKPMALPMDVLEDAGSFTFYVNEEVLVEGRFEWRADGSFMSDYSLSMAGQSVATSMEISVDENGFWDSMSMQTALGPVEVVREGDTVEITARGETNSLALRPGTALFENFSPALMSQAVLAYDQAQGGKQEFPLFIIPAVVMDASLERLETVEKSVMGQYQAFTKYRYGVPGVDVIIWVDEQNRICLGEVPAQHGAYVRDGYESLRIVEEPDSLLSQPKYEIVVDRDIEVPMRDGVRLATDIYRPDTDGKFPVIVVRTPYKKEMNELQARFYARRGYVYAVQDCRGRFSSPGEWNPFFSEPQDGYDAIEWLAVQPWSNGKVGMIGGSYLGWVQWWAAREHPPHLATIIPNVSPPDPYFNIPYEYGAFFTFGAIWWADVLESEATGDLSGEALADISEKEYDKLLKHLPVIDLDSIVLGKKNKYWREWIQHPDNDEYWERANFLEHLEELDIPVYHQSGWYDGDGIGTKLNYLAMAKHGHKYQKLVVGPWGHSSEATRRGPNNTDFGPNAIVDMQRSYTRWLDRWLQGIDNGIEREPLVSLFVMGSNQWLHGDTYPLPETKFTEFYLASKGGANTSKGDGWLSAEPPGDSAAASDTYTYDPGDPTPDPRVHIKPEKAEDESDSLEVTSIDEEIENRIAYYGRVNEERSDILVFDTPPMDEPLTFAGPISAVLYAASSAKDTDWFMRLAKVEEDGTVFPLVHGVIRARYRNSFSKPEMLEPGKVYEYHLDLWHTGITIQKGERLRVEVASASFPMFSRNLNTGGHNEMETEYISATHTIYHDQKHPSHVRLPVIPQPGFDPSGQ
jgi:putative CocE/NonD family hydrolase